jgi:isochorismate pyruvate lyase
MQILPASQCTNMAGLRAEIDRVDRQLVRLLSRRQRYIERAAEIKQQRSEIRDESRIADVLAKVAVAAGKEGLDPSLAEAVWRVLMEKSIALELAAFDQRSR